MSFKDFLKQQQTGMEAMANTGVIGLHLVSGPAVGFAIGYGIDHWFGTSPWGKLVFLFIGIAAGFLNVYRDTQALLRKMAGARRPPERPCAGTAKRNAPNGARQNKQPCAD